MPSLITKRGRSRYRASVMVNGVARSRLFPDDSRASERAAILWEEDTREDLRRESTPMDFLTVGEWAGDYLDDVRSRFSVKTYDEKKMAFRRLFGFADIQSETRVEDLNKTMARKFLKSLNEGISGHAANKARKNLARAWRWGRENMDGWPMEMPNIFHMVQRFKEERRPRYVPPEEDFWKVFHTVTDEQDRVMLLSFLHLAARRREIFRMKRSDLDFQRSQLRLWTRKRDGGLEYDWVPMTTRLSKTLLAWLKKRLAMPSIDRDHVFVCLDKTPFCDQYYGLPFKHRQHLMRRLCGRAGVKPFGFHAIRHLTASILWHDNVPIGHIQSLLRHKSATTTERYLKSLEMKAVRTSMEETLNDPGEVIDLNEIRANK